MKTWIITLPLLCAVGVAMAQGVEKQEGTDQPAAVSAPVEPAATPAERAAAQANPAVTPAEPPATAAEPAAAADKAEPPAKTKAPVKAKAPAKAKSKAKSKAPIGKRSPQTLPTGDMRHCLDQKANTEIIRCSETRRKK